MAVVKSCLGQSSLKFIVEATCSNSHRKAQLPERRVQVLLFSAAAAHRPCLCFPQEGAAKPSVFLLEGEEGKGPTAAAPTSGLCVQRTKCLETEQAPSSSTTGKHC